MKISLTLFPNLVTHSFVLIISVIITARVTQWHMFSVAALFLVCFCKLDILSYQHNREMYWWWQSKYNIFLQNKPLLSFIQKKRVRVTCEYWNNLSEALCVFGFICKDISFVILSHPPPMSAQLVILLKIFCEDKTLKSACMYVYSGSGSVHSSRFKIYSFRESKMARRQALGHICIICSPRLCFVFTSCR